MSSTWTVFSMPNPSRICRLLATVALLTMSSAWAANAAAAIPWHADLATARRAAEISHRPVLAIFTASWSSASTTLDRTTLASDEAVALITACFEPVCVDVDAHPEATRRLGITKVPTACIISADDQLLSQFELPETPAMFVAAAARGVQQAAFTSAMRSAHKTTEHEPSARLQTIVDATDGNAGALPAFGIDSGKPLTMTTPGEARGTVPPGGKAITAVAAKVRMLSDFASNDPAPAVGSESAIAASFRDQEDRLPATPPAQPAPPAAFTAHPTVTSVSPAPLGPAPAVQETSPTPTAPGTTALASADEMLPATIAAGTPLAKTVPQAPLAIEPPAVAAAAPTRSAPWLGLQNQPAAAIPAQPAPATTVATMPSTPAPTTAPSAVAVAGPIAATSDAETKATTPPQSATAATTGPAATTPAKPKASAASSLLAAVQKPFNWFTKPAAPKPPAGASGPASSGVATAATPAPVATAATASEPDPYGSMPVGLEGYCPVTLAERGVWVEGRAQWGVRHRGRTYLFASVEQQQAFLADPDRYAPALSGDDPVLAFDAGKSTPGQRRFGVTYQSRTYLFTSPETRDAFAANPQRYTNGAMVAEKRMPSTSPVVR
jgi:YHS domain-containing protein